MLAEQLESRLANGEQIDVQEYLTLSSTLVRLAGRLGIDRVVHDVGLTINELMREAASAPPESADDGPTIEVVPIEKDAPATAAEAPATERRSRIDRLREPGRRRAASNGPLLTNARIGRGFRALYPRFRVGRIEY